MKEFMEGFAAAAQLLRRAGEKGFFVEYVCLAAAVVDGALRIGLVLQHQLRTRSTEAPQELLFQGDADRIISERAIYRRAADEKVITADLLRRLEELYDKRNRVIHRYVISEITTREVLAIASDFEQVIPLINKAVWDLEDRQIREGIGMTENGGQRSTAEEIETFAARKHGDPVLAQHLRKREQPGR